MSMHMESRHSGYNTLAEQLASFSELAHMMTINNLMMVMTLKQH